ncbi:unnamed protein product [Heterobilharzia americana]|nr:unnamed protein product [Heterobilharzia americana]
MPSAEHQPLFKQYSGYLSGLTDDIQLHYWLVESYNNPEKAPLILWLNGGPGCSSLDGLMSENGPFTLVEGPKLIENPYSWNKFANVLYLEAPAGVGFSYTVNGSWESSDDSTAENNFYALLNFLKKFPEYEKRDFFITGESYGGVYVPTLALRVLTSEKFNLKAIAVGNGMTNSDLLDNSALYFANYHGLVDESNWNILISQCCQVGYPTKCIFTKNDSDICQSAVSRVARSAMNEINIYNIYAECAGGVKPIYFKEYSSSVEKHVHNDFGNLFRKNAYINKHQHLMKAFRPKLGTRLAIPCVNDSTIREFFNSPTVRKAINVKANIPEEWDVCSKEVNENYKRQYDDLSPQYTELLQSGIHVLIYNGDVDMACNYIGDEWFVDNLNLPIENTRQHWLYTQVDGTDQIGGYWKSYKLNKTLLFYTTVHGSGHMVPKEKPIAAYQMMSKFTQSVDTFQL